MTGTGRDTTGIAMMTTRGTTNGDGHTPGPVPHAGAGMTTTTTTRTGAREGGAAATPKIEPETAADVRDLHHEGGLHHRAGTIPEIRTGVVTIATGGVRHPFRTKTGPPDVAKGHRGGVTTNTIETEKLRAPGAAGSTTTDDKTVPEETVARTTRQATRLPMRKERGSWRLCKRLPRISIPTETAA